MGRKSREKRERKTFTRPARSGDGDGDKVLPGVTVRQRGQQVVLDKKMTPEQHAEFSGRIRDRVLAAPAELRAMRDRLIDIIAGAPTAEFLWRMADRFMPHDPETYRESESPGAAIQIEYPTWLALQLPAPRAGEPMTYETFAEAADLLDRMFMLTQLWLQFEGTMKRNVKEPTPEDEVIAFSRTQELAVRSPGYVFHLLSLLEALFADAGDLQRLVGFTVADLLAVMRAVHEHGSDRAADAMNAALAQTRPLIREMLRGKADATLQAMVPQALRSKMSKKQVRQAGSLSMFHGQRATVFAQAEELLTITPAWLHEQTGLAEDTCRAILKRFSLPFGQKPVADNLMSRYEPLEIRPLVPFDHERYLPLLMHLWHFGARANLEEALATDKDAWNRYDRRRARYIEDRSLALFARMLPGARVEPRLKYRMPDDKGVVQEFELDGLVTYGPVLFLIEGKGGPMSHAALRGAPTSLRQDLKELVGEAHRQATRARAFVTSAERVTFIRNDGSTLEIARADYPEIYLVSVTLESLDVFLMRLTQLHKMGIIGDGDLPWAVSLSDLEVIADHIEWGPQLIHYLRTRLPLNREDIVAMEELDFFATYLVDGLAVASELNGETFVQMATTNTRWMDDYYMHLEGTRETPADILRMRLPQTIRDAVNTAYQNDGPKALETIAGLLSEAVRQRRAASHAATEVVRSRR